MGSFHASENLDCGLLGYDSVGLAGGYQRFGKKPVAFFRIDFCPEDGGSRFF
jgi:hypothetical protein